MIKTGFNEKELEAIRQLPVGSEICIEGLPAAKVAANSNTYKNVCQLCIMRGYEKYHSGQCPLLTACIAHRRADHTSVYFEACGDED